MKKLGVFFLVLVVAPFVSLATPHITHAASMCFYYNINLGTEVPTTAPNTANGSCPTGPNGERGYSRDNSGTQGFVVPNNLSYIPLEPLPGQPTGAQQPNFCSLLSLLFKILIYLGGMLAVLYLVMGGITYMVSEVVDKRSAARERIRGAVLGLLLLLVSWIILHTVNPQLVNACGIVQPTQTGVFYPPPPDPTAAAYTDAIACQSDQGTPVFFPSSVTIDTTSPEGYACTAARGMQPGIYTTSAFTCKAISSLPYAACLKRK